MGLYDTTVMLQTVKKIYPVALFFKNRYFPTSAGDIFPTNEVLIEYKEGNKKMAPFVIPRKGGIIVEREGYTAERYAPPLIAPERPLTIDDLNKKGFGENIYSSKTPQQRQAEILGNDLAELGELIDRREEWMCREVLTTGEVTMLHYAEKYGVGEPEEKVLRFFRDDFDNEYIPEVDWDSATDTPTPYQDMCAMVGMLTKAGCKAADAVFSADAWEYFIQDSEVKEVLNNRRIEMGMINPVETPDGVAHMGQIIFRGKKIDIFVYDEEFENDNGEMEAFLPSGTVIVTAPGMGRTLYGAITQLEKDEVFHTYEAAKVPLHIADQKSGVRSVRLSSAPVTIPNDRRAWVVAQVLNNDELEVRD